MIAGWGLADRTDLEAWQCKSKEGAGHGCDGRLHGGRSATFWFGVDGEHSWAGASDGVAKVWRFCEHGRSGLCPLDTKRQETDDGSPVRSIDGGRKKLA